MKKEQLTELIQSLDDNQLRRLEVFCDQQFKATRRLVTESGYDYTFSYWCDKGEEQTLLATVGAMMPLIGECTMPVLEIFRVWNKVYYDFYNNGGRNLYYAMLGDLKKAVLFARANLGLDEDVKKFMQAVNWISINKEDVRNLELMGIESTDINDRYALQSMENIITKLLKKFSGAILYLHKQGYTEI